MKNKYGSFIQQLRSHKKLSQEEVAKVLEISRPSYIAIEKGTKHLTLEEAKAITKLFDITLEELLRGGSLSEQKFEEMIFSFLRRAREAGKELKKTKLAKLLYFADFGKYYFKGESISNLAYRKIEFGPVPDEYFRILQELEDESLIQVKPIAHEDGGYMYEISDTPISAKKKLSLLDKHDNKLINEIWKKWQDANTNDIVNYTHHQSPYMETEFNHIIPYDLIKNESKETVF
jgi:DNA-binding XRE family transcriptional regulator/uncharacterized phage-associated protein